MVNKFVILSKYNNKNKFFNLAKILKNENITQEKISKEGIQTDEIKLILKENKELFNKDDLLILLHENYTTSFTTSQLKDIFIHIKENILNNHDIMYLSNYMDDCSKYKYLEHSEKESISRIDFLTAVSPKGYFGLVSTFENWEIILEEIEENTTL